MTLTFLNPETEVLIRQRVGDGDFHALEDAVLDALRSAPPPRRRGTGRSLVEICDELRRATGGVELDISRDPSPGRVVDLS